MRVNVSRAALVTTLLHIALPAAAHHSRAIYDRERRITIDGVVTQFEWGNPHVYLYVETQSDTGNPVVWAVEHGTTTSLRRRGWSSDTFAAGDRVTVQANPSKSADRNMALVALVQKAGVTLYETGTPARNIDGTETPTAVANGLSGTWVIEQTALVGYFSEPTSWPLTEKGLEAVENYDDLTMNPQIQCMSRIAPWFMSFPGVQEIQISDSLVSIRSEYDTIERTVHMDISSHDGAAISYQGHSIGRWEDEVLVVDTTKFADHRNGNARGVPSGSQKHLVERFELNPDRTSLTYRFELEDPEYLAATVTGEVRSAYRPDLELTPIQCDLENARRFVGE